tara:strand:+ start:4488 stop:6869 length:2382 start_codon:yes stop_codon:yes gene_type:complete
MKSYGIKNGVRPTITTAEEGTIALVAGDKGAIFYNTDTDSLRTWDGSAFQDVGGGGTRDFVATGSIGAGAVVGLRSDGTVEVVTDTTGSDTLGTSQVFDSVSSSEISATYDSADKKVIICYREGALTGAGTVVVGTVSGTVITFGASQIFAPNSTLQIKAVYDSTDKKIIISHMDFSDNFYGKVIVGTLSGTVFTFGTVQTFASASTNDISAVYDQTDKKVIISYRDAGNTNYGTYIVGAVSGTVITFGTEAVFNSGTTTYTSAVYDQTDKKLIVSYKNGGNNNYGTYIAGTLSGTVVTFGTAAVFESAAISYISSVYDEVDKKVIISYQNNGNSGYGTVIVGTLNGTVITFGTAQVFESEHTSYISSVYGQTGKKVIISYRDGGNSDYGTLITGTLSGTVVTFGTAVVFESANGGSISSVYDQANKKAIISYADGGNGSYGTSIIYELGSTSTNVLDTIGINTTAKTTGETATVTILAGTSGGHSSLVIGDICYVNYQGTITQTLPVDVYGYKRLGIAVSATEILLDLLPEQLTIADIFTGSATEIQLADGSALVTGADGLSLSSDNGVPTWGTPPPVVTVPSVISSVSVVGVNATIVITPGYNAAGDLMILMCSCGYGSANYDSLTLSGWTKHVSGGVSYSQSACFTKISNGSEGAVTITSAGNSSASYLHPCAVLSVFRYVGSISGFLNYYSDPAAYTTQSLAGIFGTDGSLEVCMIACGSGDTNKPAISITGTGWSLYHSSPVGSDFYYNQCAIALVEGGSPAVSPNNCIINTGTAKIRQAVMFRLEGV